MKTQQLVMIMLIIVIASIGATMMAYSFYKVVGKTSMKYDFKVDDYVGFNVANDYIHFGTMPPGGASSTRHMDISNDNDFPVIIEVITAGDYAEFVYSSENFIELQPGEQKRINLRAFPPDNASFGNYSGYMHFIYKRV